MKEFSSPYGLVLGTDDYGRPTLFTRCITVDQDGEPIDTEPFLSPIFIYQDGVWHIASMGSRGRWETVELFISSDYVTYPESVDLEFVKPKAPKACKRCCGSKHLTYWVNGTRGECPDCNKEVQS